MLGNPPARERGPDGRPRWRRPLRLTGWRPRVYARRTCIFCCKNLCRGRFIWVGEAVVHGRYLASGPLCLDHTEVYRPAPCACGERLFALQGPRLARGGRLVDGVEYVTKRGDVVRECPRCQADLLCPQVPEP